MDDFDEKLVKMFNKEIELPENYKNMIRNVVKNKISKKRKFYNSKEFKILATGGACFMIITSMVFAKNILKENKSFNNSKGIDTAINNGYIESLDMKYVNSNNVEAKIENYLMDDFNLSFTVNVKLNNDIDVNNIEKANLANFIITDDENRIIYCDNKEVFNKYIKEKNLNYEYLKYNENYINNGINYYVKRKNPQTNTIEIVYNLYANKYPKSKILNFSFSNINLLKREELNEIEIVGEWNIKMEVPEKFYNRECIIYKLKKCSKTDIKVTNAEVYDTCMKFGFAIPTQKIEGSSEEEIKEKLDQITKEDIEKREKIYDEFCTNKDVVVDDNGVEYRSYQFTDENILKEIENTQLFSNDTYVETENGEKYYPAESNTEDGGWYNNLLEGKIEYWQTYNLTKYDATNNLKIFLKYNNDGVWEDVWLEFER